MRRRRVNFRLSAHLVVFVLVISSLGSRCGRNGGSKKENQSMLTYLIYYLHNFFQAAMQSFPCLKINFVAELLDKKQTQTLKNA
jgi:hypothetical protein